MQAVEEKLTIKVVKRDGKKVDFDASKIAIAIKKGFDSITNENDEPIYDSKDANKVFTGVMNRIDKEYKNEDKEAILDCIEDISTYIKASVNGKYEKFCDENYK